MTSPRDWHGVSLRRASRLLAALLASSACTALSDFAVHQCETDADCDILADGIRRCEASRCVDGCTDNHHCASFDPRTPICPAPGDSCAGLTNDVAGCYVSSAYDDAAWGALSGVDMSIVGAFAPTVMSSTWLTLQLGADELNAARATSSPTLAPTLVVLCNDAASTVAEGVDHLVNRLRSRTVLASFDDIATRIVTEDASLQGKALLLSPRSASSVPRTDDLLWYLGGRQADVVGAYAGLIRDVAALVERRTSAPRSLRLAALVTAAPEDDALATAVAASIDLEGRDAGYLFREDRFRRFVLSDDAPDEREQTLARLGAYAPDLVLVFAGGNFADAAREPRLSVLATLEAQLAEAPGWSPLYVLGPRALEDSTLRQLAASSRAFAARALGLSADRPDDAPRAGALYTRFDDAFPQAGAGSGLSASPYIYDALYYLAYTAAAVDRDPSLPPLDAILDGFARVVDYRGDCVDVGPESIGVALEHIDGERPFQVCGTTGAPRFSRDQVRAAPVQFFCWQPTVEQNSAAAMVQFIDNPISPAGTPRPAATCAQDYYEDAP